LMSPPPQPAKAKQTESAQKNFLCIVNGSDL
jgi:hypothetical protein